VFCSYIIRFNAFYPLKRWEQYKSKLVKSPERVMYEKNELLPCVKFYDPPCYFNYFMLSLYLFYFGQFVRKMTQLWKEGLRRAMLVRCRVFISITTKNISKLYKMLPIKLTGRFSRWFSIAMFSCYCVTNSLSLSVRSSPRHITPLMFFLRFWRLLTWHNLWKSIVRLFSVAP